MEGACVGGETQPGTFGSPGWSHVSQCGDPAFSEKE